MPKTISVAVPEACTLCPRQCKADRAAGQTGFCGAGRTLKAARAALHFWEEPCISGTRGSGTVFFSGCTLKCCFCQNYPISAEGLGKEITVERLAEILLLIADDFGIEQDGSLKLNITREDLSNFVGTATETVIRLLSDYKNDGLIEVKGRKIKLLNIEKLKTIAGM